VNAKKIVLGASAVVAAVVMAGGLAACSSGASASGSPQLAAATKSVSTSSAAPTTTSTLAPTTTTTTVAPPVTTTTKPKPKTTTPPPPALAPGVPCTVAVSACVSISQQKAWLISDGKVIAGPVTVKTGRKGYPTPVGVFHVQYHEKLHISKAFNDAPMPYSTFFTTTGVAFHEGPLTVSSHGCVHMSHANAVLWYNTLQNGQTVQVVS
jgi:lipoprotein-anchoring transpeptidase ErfK/SrfK